MYINPHTDTNIQYLNSLFITQIISYLHLHTTAGRQLVDTTTTNYPSLSIYHCFSNSLPYAEIVVHSKQVSINFRGFKILD